MYNRGVPVCDAPGSFLAKVRLGRDSSGGGTQPMPGDNGRPAGSKPRTDGGGTRGADLGAGAGNICTRGFRPALTSFAAGARGEWYSHQWRVRGGSSDSQPALSAP